MLIAAGRAPNLANANPFYAATPPPLPFVIWSIVWMALVLGAATWWFDRRDLWRRPGLPPVEEALRQVVVDQSDALHERVDDGRADELEPAPLEVD